MRRIGVVVNPIAGMGGRVGLKGTDGKVQEARERGAEPRARDRAREAMDALHQRAPETEILTYGDPMGATIVGEVGFNPIVVGEPASPETTADETRTAVRTFLDRGVDLVLFVGGDGTAVDVVEALDDAETPILGVPAGVKVYSSVFAVTPRAAGRIAADFDETERREVNDVDEDAFRGGEVRTELKALAMAPAVAEVQSTKQLRGGSVEGLAAAVADRVEPGVTYVLGPGSTVGAIADALGFESTPLGVDVWRDGTVMVRDGSEADIIDALGEDNVVIVSPIGGQGFIFGRGNPQISPEVISQSEVQVVASRRKLDDLGVLRVDTGDPDLDDALRGWLRVRVGRVEERLMKVV